MATRHSRRRPRAAFGVALALLVAVGATGDAETASHRAPNFAPSGAHRALHGCGDGIGPTPRVAVLDTAAHVDHGAEVASIIQRLVPNAEVLSIPVLDDDGQGSSAVLADGIARAIAEGADLVNLSAWLPDASVIDAALHRAERAGVVVVVAAGNEGRDLDRSPTWRRRSALACILVVGASTPEGDRLPGSNHGAAVVEVSAAGHAIATTDASGRPGVEGTSAAAAVVTGQLAAG